jgi:hypothetical protein
MHRRALAVLALLLLAGSAPAQDVTFGDHVGRFAQALDAAGEPGLAALEAWSPASDAPGALADMARRVAALPLGQDALPRLSALIAQPDPFRQEAALVVARGLVEQGLVPGVAEAVQAAAAKAVRAPSVDPWVVLAAVELAEAAPDDPLEALLGALAEVAARGPVREAPGVGPGVGPAGSRMKIVDGEAYARLDALLGRRLGRAGAADGAILAHLARRHGTPATDLAATRRAVDLDLALRQVHQALAIDDRGAAAWALAQARALAEGGPRAALVERLAAVVGE